MFLKFPGHLNYEFKSKKGNNCSVAQSPEKRDFRSAERLTDANIQNYRVITKQTAANFSQVIIEMVPPIVLSST